MLNRTKDTKLRKAILEYADADLISALCECAHNILRGTVRQTPRDVSEKVRLYNQALLRYNDMAKMSATKPTPVVVLKEKVTPTTTDIMGEVVTTLPKAQQERGVSWCRV